MTKTERIIEELNGLGDDELEVQIQPTPVEIDRQDGCRQWNYSAIDKTITIVIKRQT